MRWEMVGALLKLTLCNEQLFLRFSVKRIQAQNFWWSFGTVLPWLMFSCTSLSPLLPAAPCTPGTCHYCLCYNRKKANTLVQEWKMGEVKPFPCTFCLGFVPAIVVCALAKAADNTQACQAEPEFVGDWDPQGSCCILCSRRHDPPQFSSCI